MRRLLKGLVIFLFGGVLGMGARRRAWLFVFPFVFPPPPASSNS